MSFASEVKKELLGINDSSICCQKSLMLGMLHGSSDLVLSKEGIKIVVKSYILAAIQKAKQILNNLYNIVTDVEYGTNQNINKKRYYYLIIKNDANKLVKDFSLSPFDVITNKHLFLQNDCCKASFIRGMFIARGSINDPRKNCYHFEITCKNPEVAILVKEILISNQLDAKIRKRKENYVVYIKKSENISSALAYIGASNGVFYFEDSRIIRDISNMSNRMTNCDMANIKKSTNAAIKQLEAIEYIKKTGFFNKMPVRLQTMALMREEYPNSSLEELSEFSDNYFGKSLSKSGISHCLRSLMQFYNELLAKSQL